MGGFSIKKLYLYYLNYYKPLLMKIKLTFILIFFYSILQAQDTFYESIRLLNFKSDSLTTKDVFDNFKQGKFNVELQKKLFYDIQGEEATWVHIPIPISTEKKQLCIWNTFLDYSQLFLIDEDGKVLKNETYSLLKRKGFKPNYRFPVWEIPASNKKQHAFLKIKDYNIKTNFKIMLLNDEDYEINLILDHNNIVAQAVFLGVLLLFILILSITKGQLSLLWYAIYILIFLFEFLLHKGVHTAYGVLDYPIFLSTNQMFVPNLALFFVCLFFINFYPYTKETLYVKKAFKILVVFFSICTLIFISFFIANKIYFPKEFIIHPSRIAVMAILVFHLILTYKRVIPWYLCFGFALPIVTFFFFSLGDLQMNSSLSKLLFFDNSLYFATTIEIFLLIYYIVRKLIKAEFSAVKLQNENLELRNDFQNNLFNAQQQERNKLLNNVHDSFGGYIEALKLRLQQNNGNNNEKSQEILDEFYKEYRYLLNNLYSPKVNSDNLVENLVEFCGKINQLSDIKIQHNFSIKNTSLTQEKCVHLYRIISELSTNAIKYSNASEIKINLYQDNKNELVLSVVDNGIGFDTTKINGNSYGLNSVKERTKEMNATLNVSSEINKGTNITIRIPKDD